MLPPNGPAIVWRTRGAPVAATGRRRFQAASGPHPVEHDAFLWSLADLMTLLLVFFIMLYSNATPHPSEAPAPISESEQQPTPTDSAHAEGVFTQGSRMVPVSDVEAGEQRIPQPELSEREESVPVEKPSKALAANNHSERMLADLADGFSKDFYVRWEDRQPVFVLGERITFNAGQAFLLDGARDALRRVAEVINGLDGCQVVVTGHTDDRPIHTPAFPSNWELSAGRAASVAKALMESGVPADRLVIQGQSQFKPLMPNTTEANRGINRRVEISLITR